MSMQTLQNETVLKLLEVGIVAEVPRASLKCINPLNVAKNTSKLTLCIDLRRCFNLQCTVQHFKFESTVQALQSTDPGDHMFSFNLKLAYH